MRVVWLCPYPIKAVENIPVPFRKVEEHPAPWIVNLAANLALQYPDIELHIITQSRLILRGFKVVGADGITYHVLRDRCAIPFTCRGWPSFFPFDLFIRFWFSRQGIKKLLRRLNPDIVHAHGTENCYALAGLESEFPMIVSIQGLMHKLAEEYPDNRSFGLCVPGEKRVLKNGRYFISKTPFSRKFVEELNPSATIFDIENMMRPEFFSVEPSYELCSRVIFVGAFIESKGVRELFAALDRLNNVGLVVVGCSKSLKLARELCEEYPSLQVEWRGMLNAAQIAKEMGMVDMLVLPSYMDTSPNVVSEAMCAGLPVVATCVGGIPDMIDDGRTGLLVDRKDVSSLAEAIDRLLNDFSLRKMIGMSARDDAVGRFSPEVAVRKVMGAYHKVME